LGADVVVLLLAALVASAVYTAPVPPYVTPMDGEFHRVTHDRR